MPFNPGGFPLRLGIYKGKGRPLPGALRPKGEVYDYKGGRRGYSLLCPVGCLHMAVAMLVGRRSYGDEAIGG